MKNKECFICGKTSQDCSVVNHAPVCAECIEIEGIKDELMIDSLDPEEEEDMFEQEESLYEYDND